MSDKQLMNLADKVDVLAPFQVKAELIQIANQVLADNIKVKHVEVGNEAKVNS